jgi:hypothetical protein
MPIGSGASDSFRRRVSLGRISWDDLVAVARLLGRLHGAADGDHGLALQLLGERVVERFVRLRLHREDLERPGAVAKDDERHLAEVSDLLHPARDDDLVAVHRLAVDVERILAVAEIDRHRARASRRAYINERAGASAERKRKGGQGRSAVLSFVPLPSSLALPLRLPLRLRLPCEALIPGSPHRRAVPDPR